MKLLAVVIPLLHALSPSGGREVQILDGLWEITSDDPSAAGARWLPIEVPSAFETALGVDFDGVATYRRSFRVDARLAQERLLLSFDAVATHARVWLNGEPVGEHLGGWTPFRFDVTELARRSGENELLVRVDEKVGHNTQGFLPIIAPHFGGIWQPVKLIGLGRGWIDEHALLAHGDARASAVRIEVEARDAPPGTSYEAVLRIGESEFRARTDEPRFALPVEGFERWEVGAPRLYPLLVRTLDSTGAELDRVETRVGFRELGSEGRRILFNGRPLQVRGILEWGYYPPLLAPAPPDELVRRHVAEARARGFNLVKFCLWLPPRRILSLLDEAGMLAWVEYPTWHPRFDAEHHQELVTEFEEFFRHDRNHPCVIARSLTCETGPSASLELIRDLYERAHRAIPGAFVVDDSSWIQWNRVHDFYDDHPYGNNDTWPATLDRLNAFIDGREQKPLLLGEAIAADTWLDLALAEDPSAWWTRRCQADQARWEGAMRARFGEPAIDALLPHSLRFGMNQRKDQIEHFRRIVPDGGYVVSVARDFTLATMGLADGRDQWKWSAGEWAWHGDTMLVLGRESARAFGPGEQELAVHVAHHGKERIEGPMLRARVAGSSVELFPPPGTVLEPGSVEELARLRFTVPASVEGPTPMPLSLALLDGRRSVATNRWNLWAFPAPEPLPEEVRVVRRLDEVLLSELRAGARVLLLASDEPGSFTLRPHWFLRGAPWLPPHALNAELPPELFLDLVVKDLHPRGLLPVGSIFEHLDPIVAFWDTHDLAQVRDWAIAFETRVGEGRLLVSALRHEGSAAGEWLRARFARHLAQGPPPRSALPEEVVEAIRARLGAKQLALGERDFDFRPEPEGEEPGAWTKLRVGRHWEAQGFPALDGWARYRISIEPPADWIGEPLHLHLEGVDDAFELYLDGELVGTGGDIPARRTAFDERSSHRLTERAQARPYLLEIRVHDWYGAGGIHRPLTLSTRPLSAAAEYVNG